MVMSMHYVITDHVLLMHFWEMLNVNLYDNRWIEWNSNQWPTLKMSYKKNAYKGTALDAD